MPLIDINVLPRNDIDRASISRAVTAAVAAAIPCRLEAVRNDPAFGSDNA